MKKLILLCLTLLLTASFVISGVTLAFFSDQKSVGSSAFEMGNLSLTSVNTYSANDDPYTYVKHPSWTVQNTGTMNLNLRVKVVCQWAQTTKVEVPSEAAGEVGNVIIIENDMQFTIETEMKTKTDKETIAKVKEVPTYVISLTNDLWTKDENGWYVYQYPILPNETIQVNAEIFVDNPVWEGSLNLYFEAEAQEVSSGGGYE